MFFSELKQRRLATVRGKSQNISGISAAEITRKKQVFCVDNVNPDVSVEKKWKTLSLICKSAWYHVLKLKRGGASTKI